MGFSINPYESCVANKAINNKSEPFSGTVDDIKISQADPQFVDSTLEDLRIAYGKETPLTESCEISMIIWG